MTNPYDTHSADDFNRRMEEQRQADHDRKMNASKAQTQGYQQAALLAISTQTGTRAQSDADYYRQRTRQLNHDLQQAQAVLAQEKEASQAERLLAQEIQQAYQLRADRDIASWMLSSLSWQDLAYDLGFSLGHSKEEINELLLARAREIAHRANPHYTLTERMQPHAQEAYDEVRQSVAPQSPNLPSDAA